MKTETTVMEKPVSAVAEKTQLTSHEKQILAECEQQIQRHFETFKQAGSALLQIRELRLYRENYVSFDEYCRAKWDMTKTSANRLIAASKVSEDLAKTLPNAHEVLEHLTESAVRPLTLLDSKQRAKVMKRVVKETPTSRSITASVITQVAKELVPSAFTRRGTTPANGKDKRKPVGDLIRRSEFITALNKWVKEHDLSKISAKQVVKAVRQLIREL
jgi:hypothetical protein